VFRSKRTPLAHVIALLKRADREALAWALEPDDWNYATRQRPAALIADLERLEKAARRPWPYPVGPGRPDNYKLLFLVHDLAEKWVILTDRPFTHDWNRVKSRFSLGDQFIEAVVRFLDPKSLPALPKMLERVVEERRQRLPTIHENSELSESDFSLPRTRLPQTCRHQPRVAQNSATGGAHDGDAMDNPTNVRAGWISDKEMAKQRGIHFRTQRTERQKGIGPPWAKDGPHVFYNIEAYRKWLASRERNPVREPQTPGRKRLENASAAG
jgi:hypothetical protein